MASIELSPPISQGANAVNTDILTRFRETDTKIAVQKSGELTEISRLIIEEYFEIDIPERDPLEKRMVDVSEDGRTGFAYVRNKDIGRLVAERRVDFAVVGTDRLFEEDIDDEIEVVDSFENRPEWRWSMVLAVPENSTIEGPAAIRAVATQYPRFTRSFFEDNGIFGVDVVPTNGSTELFPYLGTEDSPIDAVLDMRATGASLAAHGLVEWTPAVGTAFPVLIQPRGASSA